MPAAPPLPATPHPAPRLKPGRWNPTLLILLLAFGRQMVSQAHKAPTMDEPHHIARGLLYLLEGTNVWNGNPPLAHVLMAAPLLLDARLVPDYDRSPDTRDFRLQGQYFLQNLIGRADSPALGRVRAAFFAARLPNMLLLVVLLSLVAAWARTWYGGRVGAVVLLLAAFDPNLLGNAQLATTDIAVTLCCLGAGYHAWRLSRAGRGRDALGLGAWAGLALGAKFSALLVLAWIALALLVMGWGRWGALLPRGALAFALSVLVVWGLYGFSFGPAADLPVPLPAPEYWGELLWQSTANIEQHPAFLAERLYAAGSAAYFPLAFLLKTPTGVVILLAGAIAGATLVPRVRPAGWPLPAAAFLGYFATFVFLPLNIGFRHLLPVLPFAYLLIGVPLRRGWLARRRPAQLALAGWVAATSLAVFPYDLAYFAEWSGGPARGYRWLVDSSLDWGQDLYALGDALGAEPGPVYVSYFGPTDPGAVGLARSPLPNWDRDLGPGFHPADPAPGLYAISATNLQGILLRQADAFDYFRRRAPDGQVGFSILLYRVPPPRTPPRWIAACEDPTFRMTREQVEQLLGAAHRLVRFDCGQSWVIPFGFGVAAGPGWYVLPPGMENAAQAWGGTTSLVYHESARLQVYAYDPQGFGAPAHADVNFADALTFMGAVRWNLAEVVTVWRLGSPSRPSLSIFGHRLAADGFTLEVKDGLGLAPLEWRPGDVLLQWHRFEGPLAPGEHFETGVYNWETGERLRTPEGQDHVSLPASALPPIPRLE